MVLYVSTEFENYKTWQLIYWHLSDGLIGLHKIVPLKLDGNNVLLNHQ